ncbi:hypothetical protein NTE_01669 [Candidatus Nitrososphaera evergladensis SR1]|jgi:uncharacterized membrane protein YwzB|uniref:Uncharacterized protein n=1 Tax=Candidatus Nitrososphaera evergladensis SR1 TaxID=1459636 RepID=A0A075MRN6_9ARCH|nr:hypothetical protein NTE_01669 [Candidatus Nitrososphaera evergladensis SR1]
MISSSDFRVIVSEPLKSISFQNYMKKEKRRQLLVDVILTWIVLNCDCDIL